MNTTQVQLKVSLSQQLSDLLQSKAARVGVPVTQFVKHIIMKEVETEDYPTFQMSQRTEQKLKKAMEDHTAGKAVKVDDLSEFFKAL